MGLMALGVVGLVLGLLQPWRTCGDDIIAAACPATGTELGVMIGAMIVGLAGFVVMFFALRRS